MKLLLAATIIVLASLLALVYFQQERMLFYPEPLPEDHLFSSAGQPVERWIESPQGRIHSLLFRSSPSRGVILYFHGNAGSLESWGDVGSELAKLLGWDVWIIDYPGFGKSPGTIRSERQLRGIANAWMETVRAEYPSRKIVLYGRSIGSGIAVRLASERGCSALVLETPYRSISLLAKEHYPYLPGFLLRYRFQTEERISEVNCPILVIHGVRDALIPFTHGKTIADLAGSKATLVAIEQGEHNDLSSFPEFWEKLDRFLQSVQ